MSSRTEFFKVDVSQPLQRLDLFLRDRFPAVSRAAIQRLIEEGHIQVDGRTVKPTHHPRAGEEIRVHWPEAKPAEAQPEEIPLEIIYEERTCWSSTSRPAWWCIRRRVTMNTRW